MTLISIISQYKHVLILPVLSIPSIYFWRKCYKTLLLLREEREFHKRHNCVIMISRNYIKGWPPETMLINSENLDRLLEPILYFFETAKHSIDVAVMMIAIPKLQDALLAAVRRGVRVRIILNFHSMNRARHGIFHHLIKAGIEVVFHVEKSRKMDRLMHLKCVVKDYSTSGGYLCIGSMNYTSIQSILNNYEDIVLTSNYYLVQQFHDNFERVWKLLQERNQDQVCQTFLKEAGY